MSSPTVKLREFSKAMLGAGCTMRSGKGSHWMWYCPCGKHAVSVAHHDTVAPNALRDVSNKMACIDLGF